MHSRKSTCSIPPTSPCGGEWLLTLPAHQRREVAGWSTQPPLLRLFATIISRVAFGAAFGAESPPGSGSPLWVLVDAHHGRPRCWVWVDLNRTLTPRVSLFDIYAGRVGANLHRLPGPCCLAVSVQHHAAKRHNIPWHQPSHRCRSGIPSHVPRDNREPCSGCVFRAFGGGRTRVYRHHDAEWCDGGTHPRAEPSLCRP
jgi:hypothetical protein